MASPPRSAPGIGSIEALVVSPPVALTPNVRGEAGVTLVSQEVQEGVRAMALNEQVQVEVRGRLAVKFGNHTLSDYVHKILPNPFCIEGQEVRDILGHYKLTMNKLLEELVTAAKTYSRPPISKYHVGVAALGGSGRIYLGVNFEIKGCPLNQAIHGEQFLLTNMRAHGETEIVMIALSAEPCGHCRQVIKEVEPKNEIQILTPETAAQKFSELLPKPFGPNNLANPKHPERLLTPNFAVSNPNGSLREMALAAARMSYAPHTEDISRVALRMKDGKTYLGSYLENAAYNPSISPLQAAIVALIMDNGKYEDIVEVVLAERKVHISQKDTTIMVLKKIARHVLETKKFQRVKIPPEIEIK